MKLQFLNKVQTPDMIEIKIKKVFEPKTDNYGKESKNCVVEWNGQDYYASFKEKYYPIAVVGNKVSAVRKSYKGSFYHEYYSGGDGLTPNPNLPQSAPSSNIAPPAQPNPLPPPPTQEVVNEKPPVNLNGRGAAFNLAFYYCLKYGTYPTIKEHLEATEKYAQQILPYQDNFVNK